MDAVINTLSGLVNTWSESNDSIDWHIDQASKGKPISLKLFEKIARDIESMSTDLNAQQCAKLRDLCVDQVRQFKNRIDELAIDRNKLKAYIVLVKGALWYSSKCVGSVFDQSELANHHQLLGIALQRLSLISDNQAKIQDLIQESIDAFLKAAEMGRPLELLRILKKFEQPNQKLLLDFAQRYLDQARDLVSKLPQVSQSKFKEYLHQEYLSLAEYQHLAAGSEIASYVGIVHSLHQATILAQQLGLGDELRFLSTVDLDDDIDKSNMLGKAYYQFGCTLHHSVENEAVLIACLHEAKQRNNLDACYALLDIYFSKGELTMVSAVLRDAYSIWERNALFDEPELAKYVLQHPSDKDMIKICDWYFTLSRSLLLTVGGDAGGEGKKNQIIVYSLLQKAADMGHIEARQQVGMIKTNNKLDCSPISQLYYQYGSASWEQALHQRDISGAALDDIKVKSAITDLKLAVSKGHQGARQVLHDIYQMLAKAKLSNESHTIDQVRKAILYLEEVVKLDPSIHNRLALGEALCEWSILALREVSSSGVHFFEKGTITKTLKVASEHGSYKASYLLGMIYSQKCFSSHESIELVVGSGLVEADIQKIIDRIFSSKEQGQSMDFYLGKAKTYLKQAQQQAPEQYPATIRLRQLAIHEDAVKKNDPLRRFQSGVHT